MPRRATTLNNNARLDITREIESKFDYVRTVAENIDAIQALAGVDSQTLLSLLNEATNFTGLTVVSGEEAGWNPATKVLTVPTVQGPTGLTGPAGNNGRNGLTPEIEFSLDQNGDIVYNITYTTTGGSSPDSIQEW